jgi:HPt (histidine-containing phosphotransfer) domain-containing protein
MTNNGSRRQVAEVIDWLGGDTELFWELCRIFQEEYPKQLQKLRQAVADDDSDSLMRAAHNLRGDLRYLGAATPAEAARELEEMGRKKDWTQVPEKLARLEEELADLMVRLKHAHGSAL